MSLLCSFVILVFAGNAFAAPRYSEGLVSPPFTKSANIPDSAFLSRFELDLDAKVATEYAHTDPISRLVTRRRYRWIPEMHALVIESTLTNPTPSAISTESMSILDWGFRIFDEQDDGRYRALAPSQELWYGSTFWTGPDWTRVGKDWQHSGENTPSVRRFTAPRDGRITVAGRVYKADTNNGGGDGVRLEIRHGRDVVWSAEINGDDAQGVEPNLSLDVRKGDAVRFVVHKRDHIACDTTHWDPVIAYDDRDRFMASEGFTTVNSGQGNWRYELETDSNEATGLPSIRAFGRDTSLREAVTLVGTPQVVASDTALPLIVISDDSDASGMVLALNEPGPWTFTAELTREGILRVALDADIGASPSSLNPGASHPLPCLAVLPYSGPWTKGFLAAQSLLESTMTDAGIDALRAALAPMRTEDFPTLDLWAMMQADWHLQDKLTEDAESYAAATKRHCERAIQLVADLRANQPADFLAAESQEIDQLAARVNADHNLVEWRSLYSQVRRLKRSIALKNPLLNFDQMLFCKRVPTSYSHLVMQYYGWRARPGGGLFILERPGYSLRARDILNGELTGGCVLEPRLSYDAQRVVFSYVACSGKNTHYSALNNDVDEDFYHVWEVNVDGTGLHQLTAGPYDDVMPTYVPDGGIAFCSTRRKGYARCFGEQFSPRWHVYTLHRMNGDGTDIRTLSFHDTNEWFPAVSNSGLILYSRWDYIDRDAVTHQNLWSTRPDGTNPAAVWGNATPTPHCTFQLQPIPNSNKVIFTASAHHSIAGGSIAIVDPTIANNGQEAITRITPEIPFPEAEGMDIKEYYESPWPLSEKYYLVSYSPTPLIWEPGANLPNALGIYLLDAAGNRELIYRDPDIGSTNAVPLMPRPVPPVVSATTVAESETPVGEMMVMDVYQGLGDVPRGTIKALRIIQVFPKTTVMANTPPIGMALEENGRAVLGTVPVEADGSARFLVPAQKPVLFQCLDENGIAYQTMRSLTYVQSGERVSCIGCHEQRMTTTGAAPKSTTPLAIRRAPSTISPGPFEGEPFSYTRVVQPIWDKHCVTCHSGAEPKKGIDLTGTPEKAFTKSYMALCGDRDFWGGGTNPQNAAEALVPRYGGRNQVQVTQPGGLYGARGSRLIQMLRKGHNKVELSDDEFRRIAMWIDCNAIFYGVNKPEDQARQLQAEAIPMPEIQ